MSEYQYYEFRALDRPLTPAQQAELRRISTRAEITAHHLTNEYHFGDFKGDPNTLLRDYFDAFLYFANWGTHRLAFGMPAGGFDATAAEPYADGDRLDIKATRGKVIVWFEANVEAPDWDEVEADLDDLLPLRDELLAGDLRPLYLGWLARVQHPDDDEGEEEAFPEPPVPPGLGKLTPAQKALAEFLWLDEHLLWAAPAASPAAAAGAAADLDGWLRGLPTADKERWFLRLAGDDTQASRRELLRLFRQQTAPRAVGNVTGRTSTDLRSLAQQLREGEARRQAQQQQRRREAALTALARRGEAAWQEVDGLIATKQSGSYDQAIALLKDLRELARRDGTQEAFAARVVGMRKVHAKKLALIERLNRAGMP